MFKNQYQIITKNIIEKKLAILLKLDREVITKDISEKKK